MMHVFHRFFLIFTFLTAFFFLAVPCPLQALDGQNVSVSVGIPAADGVGVWKPGRQVPFRVTLNPSEESERFQGRIELEIPDPDGIPVRSNRSFSGPLPATVELEARFGHSRGEYRLKIFDETDAQNGGKLVHESKDSVDSALSETRGVILVVGPTDAGLEACVAQMARPADRKPRIVRLASAAELPQNVSLWELVDVLVVTTDDESVLDSWTDEKTRTLETWARFGGTVVLSVGKNAPKWVELPQWKAFRPGKLEKVLPVRETSAMELFAQSPIPVTLLGVSEKYRIPVAKFTELPPQIEVRAEQFDLPLVLRRSLELGTVHWLTFDLDHPALVKWEGRGNLLATILGVSERTQDFDEKKVHGMELGYDDISGQLRSALDDFEGLKPVSFVLLAFLFLIYLGIIGPGSWFLCKKLPRGGEAASWTLFLVAAVGGAFLLWTLTNWGGGGRAGVARLNQVQVVDYVQETGSTRVSLWGNVWSPTASRLDVKLEPISRDLLADEEVPVSRIHWFGLPGAYLGGMDSQLLSAPSLDSDLDAAYEQTDDGLENIPFFARSTKSFCADCRFRIKRESALVFGTLRDVNHSRVMGEIRNPLSVPLEHCIVFYGGWAYEAGTLPAGGTFTIDDSTPYFAASALLVDADYIEDHSIKHSVGVRRVNRPYAPNSHDLRYITRTLLFYGKAGGRSYTTLNDAYVKNLDASELLNSRTAILLGFVGPESTVPFFTSFQVSGNEPDFPQDKRLNVIRAFIEVP